MKPLFKDIRFMAGLILLLATAIGDGYLEATQEIYFSKVDELLEVTKKSSILTSMEDKNLRSLWILKWSYRDKITSIIFLNTCVFSIIWAWELRGQSSSLGGSSGRSRPWLSAGSSTDGIWTGHFSSSDPSSLRWSLRSSVRYRDSRHWTWDWAYPFSASY